MTIINEEDLVEDIVSTIMIHDDSVTKEEATVTANEHLGLILDKMYETETDYVYKEILWIT